MNDLSANTSDDPVLDGDGETRDEGPKFSAEFSTSKRSEPLVVGGLFTGLFASDASLALNTLLTGGSSLPTIEFEEEIRVIDMEEGGEDGEGG